mgnify:CR=1 FL=1
MSILNQKTLKRTAKFEGVGLHTGEKVSISILPSKPNTGIIFKRIDLKSNNVVIPNVYNVSNATLCTTITNEHSVSVSTIEHLMGALYGLGIDNAFIEINSQEVPIMDGSAKNFVEKFLEIGFELSEVPIKLIKIMKEVSLEDGLKSISIGKSNVSLDIDFEIKYSNSRIGNQKIQLRNMLFQDYHVSIAWKPAETVQLDAEELLIGELAERIRDDEGNLKFEVGCKTVRGRI